MDKWGDHDVEIIEAGEDLVEALESVEQSLDFVAPLVDRLADMLSPAHGAVEGARLDLDAQDLSMPRSLEHPSQHF
jgi:hypothetical protein